jgi:hypothetical protein
LNGYKIAKTGVGWTLGWTFGWTFSGLQKRNASIGWTFGWTLLRFLSAVKRHKLPEKGLRMAFLMELGGG